MLLSFLFSFFSYFFSFFFLTDSYKNQPLK
jgi:hypothetical protein